MAKARRPDYNPVAVTLEGCLHRFVRPESLGAHDRWICTRRALLLPRSSLYCTGHQYHRGQAASRRITRGKLRHNSKVLAGRVETTVLQLSTAMT